MLASTRETLRRRPGTMVAIATLVALSGACTLDAPLDPGVLGEEFTRFFTRLDDRIDDALVDPLGTRPFPTLIGGDSERIIYAVNLGDVRLNFDGPTNDIVIPGFVGPSNLLKIEDARRDLIRPLIPVGTLLGLASDGQTVAYIAWVDPETPGPFQLIVGGLALGFEDDVAFELSPAEGWIKPDLDVSAGRVAFVTGSVTGNAGDALRVFTGQSVTTVAEAEFIEAFDLLGTRLAYVFVAPDGTRTVALRDLFSGDTRTLAGGLTDVGPRFRVHLSDNHVVWNEPVGPDLSRIAAYNISTGQTTVWSDAVEGELRGATDEFFVTQVRRVKVGEKDRVDIIRHTVDGRQKELANFQAEGLAGQASILGDRVVFVNARRDIVVVPLVQGDRVNFSPY